MSYNKQLVIAILNQIKTAINDLKEWNKSINNVEDFYSSPDGMRNLAADCMLVEAIGEGFKRVDKETEGKLLPLYSNIHWNEVFGIRNRIAHGYFDIDGEVIFQTIRQDLDPLLEAVSFLLMEINKE